MAILNSIPGLEVWINVDGEPATEYDDPNNEAEGMGLQEFDVPPDHGPEPPYIIKYIEAKHGAPFSFHYLGTPSVQKPGQSILARYWIDGTKVLMEFETRHDPERGALVTTTRYSCDPADGYHRRSFSFSQFKTVEKRQVREKDGEDMENCGILHVTFSHIAGTDEHFEHDIRPHSGNGGHTGAPIVAEKVVKRGNAVDCKTAYTPLPDDPTRRKFHTYNHHFTAPNRRPFAVFEFRYRSREGLIKEGIIPHSSPKDEIENTRDAKRSLRRVKRKASDDATSIVKTENDSRIKRQARATANNESRTRYKTRRFDSGRVEVDLTDD